MTLRTTQNKNVVGNGAAGGGFSIRGSQAHSNLMAKKWGNEERAKITLPKLKFLEGEIAEDHPARMSKKVRNML